MSDAGRQRWALDALEHELVRVEPTSRRAPSLASRPAFRATVAGGVAALIAFIAFTPPGHAIADELAELVGIGEPASLPPEDHSPVLTSRGQALVIASGTAPDGTPYEVVADRSLERQLANPPSPSPPVNPASPTPMKPSDAAAPAPPSQDAADSELAAPRPVTCATVDLPDTPELNTVEVCHHSGNTEFLSGESFGATNYADRAPPDAVDTFASSAARYLITSDLPPAIDDVRVTYTDASGEQQVASSDIGRVDDEIGGALDVPERFGYLVAFLPDDGLPSALGRPDQPGGRTEPGVVGTVELTGYDSDGQVIARDNFGQRVTRTFDSMHQRATTEAHFQGLVEQARQRDGLALTRDNVELCSDALKAGAARSECLNLIDAAASRGLYGWNTGGGG